MKKYIIVLICLFWAKIGQSQSIIRGFNTQQTPLWEMRSFSNDPLKVRYYTFPNGLTLITSNQKISPRVYTMIAVRTGSKNDPSTNTGLAHYLEHMLFKGTDKYGSLDWSKEEPLLKQIDGLYELYNHTTDPKTRKNIYRAIDSISQAAAKFAIANEYDKMCQALGAEGTNAFTSNDETVYINDIPSNMVSNWLSLEAERFRKPILRLFHTELEAVYEEKNISLDRDGDKVYEKLFAELFKGHNYGLQTTIGTVEHLKNPSLEAIRNYYNEYYVPNNMAIIMSGDFDPDAVAAEVAAKFSYMQKTDIMSYVFKEEISINKERGFDVVGPDAESVTIGFRIPNAGTEEARAAKLVDLLLNNSVAGFIDLNLVKEQKLLSANSGAEQMMDYGVFMLTGKPKTGQTLEEVKDLLLGQLEKVRKGEFDKSMLDAILLNEEISNITKYKDNESRCFFLKDAYVQGIDYRDAYNDLAAMREMNKDFIVDFANLFLNQDRIVIYKRKGESAVAEKIEKPEIHAVELNRDKQSQFVKQWLAMPSQTIQPLAVNLKEVVKREYVGPAVLNYVQNADNKLFSLSYRYDYGKWHNKSLSLVAPYMKLVGTKGYSAADVSKAFYRWGCKFAFMEGNDHYNISIDGPEEYFDSAVWLLDRLMNEPAVDEVVCKQLLQDVLKNRADAKLNPSAVRRALSQYAIYGPQNPSTWTLSNQELEKMKAEDIVKLLKGFKNIKHSVDYYGPREQAALAKTILTLHALPADQTKHELAFDLSKSKSVDQLFKEQTQMARSVYFVHYSQVQASINWFYKSSVVNESEAAITTAFNQYFGGDMSSVVFQNIREAKALAYSTYAVYNSASMRNKPNIMMGYVGTQADKFHDAIGAMNELLTGLPKNDDIFSLAKQSLINRMETNRIKPEEYIGALHSQEEMGFSTTVPDMKMYAALPNLQMGDIVKFHQERVSGKPYTLAIVADRNRVTNADLSRYGKVTELTLEQIFAY
jgi:predicted Zn-dependent peptidase